MKMGAGQVVIDDEITGMDAVWAAGYREGTLAKLVAEYKYQSVRACGEVLAEMLDEVIPREFGDGLAVIVVPVPTIGKHVRERGLDHTMSLAKKLARKRRWRCERALGRRRDTVQVGANKVERKAQAKNAFEVVREVREDTVYLLLDDVWTTGASMRAAAEKLREAGATKVYGVVVEVGLPKHATQE